jgi:VIT1/CCC1 family predicted Fe2+/Mn2+ transporter
MPEKLDSNTRAKLLTAQRNEITEHIIYSKLSKSSKSPHNRKLLEGISQDEFRHYGIWKKYTGQDVKPSALKIWKYVLIARLLGLTFGLKLMEKGEEGAQDNYGTFKVPEAAKIQKEENQHENKLLDLIDEQKLRYVGSIVLGLNDALVELTGTLAGLTFAFQNSQLISLAGLITGIAASLSMGASEYLSTKSEGGKEKSAGRASLYTTIAYILTVVFLISPFFLFSNYFLALGITVVNAVIVIFIFTFYISVAKDLPFRRRFAEMAGISLGVAGLTFIIGMLVRIFLGINI